MNFQEYQPLAARTSDPDRPLDLAVLYGVASLVGEWAEWLIAPSVHSSDEAGDVCWSVAELARVWGVVDRIAPCKDWATDLTEELGVIAEASKKWACHGRDREDFVDDVADALCNVLGTINGYHDLSEVYAHNVDKLTARYPDGFVQGGGRR